MSYFGIIVTFALVNNVVLSQLLGICPCIGAPRRLSGALAMGTGAAFLMSVTAMATWALSAYVLEPLGIEVLQILVFAGVAFLLTGATELALGRVAPSLLRAAGFSLQPVGLNCAVLGLVFTTVRAGYGPLESLVAGAAAGTGFLTAIVLMSAIRDRLDSESIPRVLRGAPISLISAGLVALAFLAFDAAFARNLMGAGR